MSSFFQYALRRAAYDSLRSGIREMHKTPYKNPNQNAKIQELEEQLNEIEKHLEQDENQIKQNNINKTNLQNLLYYAVTRKFQHGVTIEPEQIKTIDEAFEKMKEEVKNEPFVKIQSKN